MTPGFDDRFHCVECGHGWNAIDETECPRDECPNCGHAPMTDRGSLHQAAVTAPMEVMRNALALARRVMVMVTDEKWVPVNSSIAGSIGVALDEVDAALATSIAAEPAPVEFALRSLLQSGVGRQTLQNLADGQGTNTDDGRAWLAAAALVAPLTAASEDAGITQQQWERDVVRVMEAFGESEADSTEIARTLWDAQDHLSGEIGDPMEEALCFLEERPETDERRDAKRYGVVRDLQWEVCYDHTGGPDTIELKLHCVGDRAARPSDSAAELDRIADRALIEVQALDSAL